jgi:SOS-response transcriptional repressor LexA
MYDIENADDIYSINRYLTPASLGKGNFDDVDENFKDEVITNKKHVTFAVVTKGDSMESFDPDEYSIKDGDTVFIQKNIKLKSKDIGLFRYDGEIFCKRYIKRNNQIRLVSLNPEYKDIIVDKNKEFVIEGKVIDKKRI